MNSRRARGSRLATGSSSTSSSGRLPIASARASWARWPPDSDPARCRGSRSNRLISSPVTVESQCGFRRDAISKWSATLIRVYSGASWATNPTRASCFSPSPGRPPSTEISPSVALSSPTVKCNRVVLPAPLDPTSPTTRPDGTRSDVFRSAHRRPYRFPSPVASIATFTPLHPGERRATWSRRARRCWRRRDRPAEPRRAKSSNALRSSPCAANDGPANVRVTNVPTPALPSTSPSNSSSRYAFDTVFGLIATIATTSFTVGN